MTAAPDELFVVQWKLDCVEYCDTVLEGNAVTTLALHVYVIC